MAECDLDLRSHFITSETLILKALPYKANWPFVLRLLEMALQRKTAFYSISQTSRRAPRACRIKFQLHNNS